MYKGGEWDADFGLSRFGSGVAGGGWVSGKQCEGENAKARMLSDSRWGRCDRGAWCSCDLSWFAVSSVDRCMTSVSAVCDVQVCTTWDLDVAEE